MKMTLYLQLKLKMKRKLFSDNDTLSAIVAILTKASKLILLSDIDGLYSEDPRNNPDAKAHLEEIRQHIFEGRLKEAQRLMNLTMSGCPDSMHPYQTLGDINIYSSGIEDVENYKRSLNLEEAVCLVEFDSRSVHFKREMFLSYPKDCLVIRFTADKSSQIFFSGEFIARQIF